MKNKIYENTVTIPFQDIDAAGIVFFAHLLRYAHDCYERFMSSIDISLVDVLEESKYLVPLVHVEADYRIPLKHGEDITIFLSVEKIGRSSFTVAYIFKDENNVERAVAKTVHVLLDGVTKKKIKIPEIWQQKLEEYC